MALTPIQADYADLELARQMNLLEMERRFGVPGCPYDCWDGWHTVLFRELDPQDHIPSDSEIVLPWGLILTPCGCNSAFVWKNGHIVGHRTLHYPDWVQDRFQA